MNEQQKKILLHALEYEPLKIIDFLEQVDFSELELAFQLTFKNKYT